MTSSFGFVLLAVMFFLIGGILGDMAYMFAVVGHKEESMVYLLRHPSGCPVCGKKENMKVTDLIPLPWFILQRGKRACCGKPLPLSMLGAEIGMGMLTVASIWAFGVGAQGVMVVSISWFFLTAAVSDMLYREVPNELMAVMAMASVLCIVAGLNTWGRSLLGLLPGLILLGIDIAFLLLLKKPLLGGGDIKFFIMIGALLGIDLTLAMIFLDMLMTVVLFFPKFIRDMKDGSRSEVPIMYGALVAYIYLLLLFV